MAALTLALLASAGSVAQANQAPHLSEQHAIRLMRTALLHSYPIAWHQARGHRLVCPVAVRPARGGATQDEEIRRRCFFSWTADGTSYSGRGLVWLGGADAEGARAWTFQARVVEKTGRHMRTVYLAGRIRS